MPSKSTKTKTPTFILEIPLVVSLKDVGALSSRFEAGRQLYNACLGEAIRRLKLVKQSQKILCQRDLYSAFLSKFVDDNLLQVDQAKSAWSGTEPFLLAAWRRATKKETNLRVEGRVPSSFGKFPESERVATKVLIADAKDLDVVPTRESQVEASHLLQPPSL